MKVVLVNPVAGNGKAKRIYDQIKQSPYFKEATKFYQTKYKGHIAEIIRKVEQSRKSIQVLFVIGGDGTMHEVINAITDKSIRLAYIPGGSGNDFAREVDFANKHDEIIEGALQSKKEVAYWLGYYQCKDQKRARLLNCIGFGFDAAVTERARKLSFRHILSKLKLDRLIYLFALLRELFFYQPLPMTLVIDGVEREYDRVLFLTINNQPYMGGGMKVNPTATNNMKDMSVIVVHSIAKWKVFLLFGTVFFGKHTLFKEVEIYRGKKITVTSDQLLPYQVDGENGKTYFATVTKDKEPIYLKGTI